MTTATLLPRTNHPMLRLLFAAAITACAGKAPTITPRPLARIPAHPEALLLPQVWHSRVQFDRTDSIILTLPAGATQVQRLTRHAMFTLTVGPRSAVTLRLDSLVLSPAPASLPAVGAVWTGRMLGTRVDWQTTAAAGYMIEDLGVDVAGFFPRLPPGGVAAGARWSDTSTIKGRVDIFETTQRLTTKWVADPETAISGATMLPLRAVGALEQSGKGSEAGIGMTMTGQGSRSCVYYLSKDGRIGQVTRRDSVNVLISIPSSHQLVPTLRLIRSRVVFTPLLHDKST